MEMTVCEWLMLLLLPRERRGIKRGEGRGSQIGSRSGQIMQATMGSLPKTDRLPACRYSFSPASRCMYGYALGGQHKQHQTGWLSHGPHRGTRIGGGCVNPSGPFILNGWLWLWQNSLREKKKIGQKA